jgi:hypothetical protein
MMYRTTVDTGVFWQGPQYELKPRRWLWLAKLCARYHLTKYPYRAAYIKKVKA